jgi:LysM domain-containing protein
MTAITLPAPRRVRPTARFSPATTRRAVPPSRGAFRSRPRVGGPVATRRRSAVVPVGGDRCRSGRPQRLRLTRRGRLLITTTLTAAGICATMFTGAVSLAGTQAGQVPVRYVTVGPGETLWSIAGEAAPGKDRRDTIHRIVDLNALRDSQLEVGQRVAVPAGG